VSSLRFVSSFSLKPEDVFLSVKIESSPDLLFFTTFVHVATEGLVFFPSHTTAFFNELDGFLLDSPQDIG